MFEQEYQREQALRMCCDVMFKPCLIETVKDRGQKTDVLQRLWFRYYSDYDQDKSTREK